jgi:hypothetical protein
VFSFALYFSIYRVFLLFGSDELCLHGEGAVLAHRIHGNEKTWRQKKFPQLVPKRQKKEKRKKKAATLNLRRI